jgi:hypothetical protein
MRFVVVAASLLLPSPLAAHPTSPKNPLVGTWQLEEYVDAPEGGAAVYAFGKPPIGLFVFTADGHVSISLMRNPPAVGSESSDPDPDACIPAWYCSYFGTYRYDPAGPSWTAHVTGGNIPNYLGTDQARSFQIKGDLLTISETYSVDGKTFHAKRVLRRIHR